VTFFLIHLLVSFSFLAANLIVLLAILALNRRVGDRVKKATTQAQEVQGQKCLTASDILGWEFEYARITASEAMRDRHTMINFYLLSVGVIASGVVAVLARQTDLPKATSTLLLWLLCGIGWLYFLKLIRLRQSWHDSARTMNRIKDFYIQHAKEFTPDVLSNAFRWQAQTMPSPHKPWTLFFYSAMLIGFLDSVAYVGGSILLGSNTARCFEIYISLPLVLFGLIFFAFHIWLYFAFLKPTSATDSTDVTDNSGR
jgi:hypothetical protein